MTTARQAESQAEGGRLVDLWQQARRDCETRHRAGTDGLTVAHGYANAVQAVVLQASAAPLFAADSGVALVALGGFGRGEMAPHSDVDLLFLFARERDQRPEWVSTILGPLWDLRFDVGHSSATIAQAVKLARQHLETCTAMLDARWLAGDLDLFARFRQRLYQHLPRTALGRLQAWRQRRLERRDSVQLLEPNVKESPGGLRDLQAIDWAIQLAHGTPDVSRARADYLGAADAGALTEAAAFLWRVRHELHLLTQRRRDVLEHELKPGVAAALGYREAGPELGAEAFMRDYYLHGRTAHQIADDVLLRLCRRLGRTDRVAVLGPGVRAVNGELLLDDPDAYLAADAVRLLLVPHQAQRHGLRLGAMTRRALRAAAAHVDDAFRTSAAAREALLAILRGRRRVAATVRQLHELGILGAYLPEFGALTCLVQYDPYHVYTVDEHTLVALENLERLGGGAAQGPLAALFGAFRRRELVFLAALLHDIGKSMRQDHIVCGIRLTRSLCVRMGLTGDDTRFLCFAVEHHQDMVIMSQRRDLDDHRMIADFAALFPAMAWLQALYLVSYADLSAVARDAWTDWHGVLLHELYHKVAEQLESGMATTRRLQHGRNLLEAHLREVADRWAAPRVAAFRQHVEQLPPRYLLAYGRSEIEQHLDLIARLAPDRLFELEFVAKATATGLMVCTRDQHQLLAKICGVLAANDVDIRRADVNTRDDGIALDLFQVTDLEGSPTLPEWKQDRVRQRLGEVIARRLKARELLQRYSANWGRRRGQRRAVGHPPAVQIENQVSDRYTVIDVEAPDSVGLLYVITYALADMGLDIHTAMVNTVAGRARDAFYVVDARGEKIVNYETLQTVRQRLLAEVSA